MDRKLRKLKIAWQNMRQRCGNPKRKDYRYYGGRGIAVRFNCYEHFARHIGLPPSENASIDRIDNNGDYRHGNIRWADAKVQANNRRGVREEIYQQLEFDYG